MALTYAKEAIQNHCGHMKDIYVTFHYYQNTNDEPKQMSIIQMCPALDWTKIWRNLHDAPITTAQKILWYTTIYDLHATNYHLNTLTSGHVERRDCSPMRC
jgi:hypothetical protein